jgi:hypothetical protein
MHFRLARGVLRRTTGFIATRSAGAACFQDQDPSAAHYLAALPVVHFTASVQADTTYAYSNEVALAVGPGSTLVVGANALPALDSPAEDFENPAWYGSATASPRGGGPNSVRRLSRMTR